jgi:hypothetical protein
MRRTNLATISQDQRAHRAPSCYQAAAGVWRSLRAVGYQPFAFTLIIGFLTGTYSSIFIAAPVVLFWSTRSKLATAE